MNNQSIKSEPKLDDLPFEIEKGEDHLIITAKPKTTLRREQKKQFEKTKAVVEVVLFDDAYFERMSKVQDFSENYTFADFLRDLKFKVKALLIK